MSRPQKGRKPWKRFHRRATARAYMRIAWPQLDVTVEQWGQPTPLRQGNRRRQAMRS